jgi:hypothetical protein
MFDRLLRWSWGVGGPSARTLVELVEHVTSLLLFSTIWPSPLLWCAYRRVQL